MKVSKHNASGLWSFKKPAKWSAEGKREEVYFSSKKKADDEKARLIAEHNEHGRSAMSSKQRAIMTVAEQKYPSINILVALEHYKQTKANIRPISVRDAVEDFIKRIQASTRDDDTKNGYRNRLRPFAAYLGDIRLDEVTADDVDKFLQTKSEGSDRRSYWKALNPFFKHAVSPARWVIKNPLLEFSKEQKPEWSQPKRQIYTPEQYGKMLEAAAVTDEYVIRYLVLAGMGFFRPEELIRASAKDQVLAWKDIQLDRELIHVREQVAKGTGRRGGDARYVNLKENETLLKWLRQEMTDNQLTGNIIPLSEGYFRQRLNKVYAMAGVKPIPDGLRHSSISYYLALHAGTQVRQVGEWAGNSEATIQKYYLQYLRPEEGQAWFHVVDQLIKG